MKPTQKELYAKSPRKAANDRIADGLRELAPEYAYKFESMLVTRGKRIGLLPKSCPAYSKDKTGVMQVLWHAYEDTLCEIRAGQYGFFPNRSYGGSIGAMMFCDRVDAKDAYDLLQSLLIAEYKRGKK